jgi:hypothetical protein
MVGTCAAPAAAKAVRPVAALRCRSLRRGGTGFRTLDRLPLAVYVGAIVGAIGLGLLRRIASCRGRAALRSWRWLRLRREQLR